MYATIDKSDFLRFFRESSYSDQFTHEAKCAIWENFKELELDMDKELRLDIPHICAYYVEYDSIEELQEQYPDCKALDIISIEELKELTTVIPVDGERFVIRTF
nr:hypothetical protein [uncultured Mediterranean phage uvMED]